MLNVLENFTIMISLMKRGIAGGVTLLKNADRTHLNLIDTINTLSLIVGNIFSEIHQIENLHKNCNRFDLRELNNHIMKTSTEPLSIMFKNIDGVTSNFNLFSTEITSTNDKLSVITLGETNLDECNKNLFNIRGYQSVYQSKITGKHKGSGLAIYLKDVFLHTQKDEWRQCTSHLESLFISINNTDTPLTIGVIYRPPNQEKTIISRKNNNFYFTQYII